MFISAQGNIYQLAFGVLHRKFNLPGTGDPELSEQLIIDKENLGGNATGLSVDWLYDKIYVAVQVGDMWGISVCDLMSPSCNAVTNRRKQEILALKADPYNG